MDRGRSIASGTIDQLVRETVERHTMLTLEVEGTLPPGSFTEDVCRDGSVVTATLDDVGRELPPILEKVRLAGCRVARLDVRRPGIAEVFVRLTGRDLRE